MQTLGEGEDEELVALKLLVAKEREQLPEGFSEAGRREQREQGFLSESGTYTH